jgi:hypothetical protein
MEDDSTFLPPDPLGADSSSECEDVKLTVRMQKEIVKTVAAREFDSAFNQNIQLTLKNEAMNLELRELERMRKYRYNTIITFVVCTCITVLGGIIIASDTT